MTFERKQDYSISEISIDVNVTSFMLAVSTFFTGFLISSFKSLDSSVTIPILFLIVSTVSFLFTNIIFANAAGEIRAENIKGANKHARVGNVISEYLGIYLLVISIPLAINALTADSFLTNTVFIICTAALFGYSVSSFSIVHRYIKRLPVRLLYAAVLACVSLGCFLTQKTNTDLYVAFSIFLISFLLLTTLRFFLHKRD